MWTTRAETAPEGSYHYACNMIPMEPRRADSYLTQRPTVTRYAVGSTTGTVVAMGSLSKVDGTVVSWVLTTAGLWQITAGSESSLVSAANLSSKSAVVGSPVTYWCVYNNTVIFNPHDGVNKPWSWDGSAGAGGVTLLSAAPLAYGRPTVYYRKLFFIAWSFRDSIYWSEEDAAGTGYNGTGYTNFWALTQSGTAPLYVLYGTNEALYYFRQSSIGAIRGAANPDFKTSGVHDSISQSVGSIALAGVQGVDNDLWFVDQFGVPNILRAGGQPHPLIFEVSASSLQASEPFGFDDAMWNRSTSTVVATNEVFAVPALATIPYRTVWFNVRSETTDQRAFLVCDAEAGRPLAWFVPYTGVALARCVALIQDTASLRIYPMLVASASGTVFLFGDTQSGGDQTTDATVQTTTWRVIGAPLGTTDYVEYQFDRLDLVGAASGTTETIKTQLLTSYKDSSASVSTAQTPVIGTSDSLDRIAVGCGETGRWTRPVFTVQSTALAKLVLASWTVTAFPLTPIPSGP